MNKSELTIENTPGKQTGLSRSEQAKAYFLEGYNCAQAVVLAFCDELDMDKETAARMASSFGGGMGRLREVCGSVSGMFLTAGLLCGYSRPGDAEGKKAQYQRVQELARAFQEKNGSIVCRELLNLKQKSDAPTPSARTTEYYKKRPCAELVADAAGILEEMLATSASSQSHTRLPGDSRDSCKNDLP